MPRHAHTNDVMSFDGETTRVGLVVGTLLRAGKSELAVQIINTLFRSPVDTFVPTAPDTISLVKAVKKGAPDQIVFGNLTWDADSYAVVFTSENGMSIPGKTLE